MKIYILTLLIICTNQAAFGQWGLSQPSAKIDFHANEIKTVVLNGGDIFWDLDKGRYQVPFLNANAPNTIFTTSICIGGIKMNGDTTANFQAYRSATQYDYTSGFYDTIRMPNDTIFVLKGDTIWSVTDIDIKQHLTDWRDNGRIDNPNRAVFGFPARGNTFFQNYNGFPWRDIYTASFFDRNNNGYYEPNLGEYPLPEGVDTAALPAQMTWCVFSSVSNFRSNMGKMEIQLTTWAFNTTDTLLNRTIFTRHKITNRSLDTFRDAYIGMFTDFDMGCYADNGIGSAPILDTYYAYNLDSIDNAQGICNPTTVSNYGSNTPTQTITFLNRPLSKFIFTPYNCDLWWGLNGVNDYKQAYRCLSGKWANGNKLTYGGNGFAQSNTATDYIFSDDPNIPNGWSMRTFGLRCPSTPPSLGSTYIERFLPQQTVTLDIAWATHFLPNSGTLRNVSYALQNVPRIKQIYNNNFLNVNTVSDTCVMTDCVYPGDLNNDGIADNRDALPLAFALNATGNTRIGNLNWRGKNAQNWQQNTSNGINYKHLDADGNGRIDLGDWELTKMHFGFKTPFYNQTPTARQGNDLVFSPNLNPLALANLTGQFVPSVRIGNRSDLLGVAFALKRNAGFMQAAPPTTLISNPLISFISPVDYTNLYDTLIYFAFYSNNNTAFRPNQGLAQLNFYNTTANIGSESFIRFVDAIGITTNGEIVNLGIDSLRVRYDFPNKTQDTEGGAISVYPNPTSGELNLYFSQNDIEEIQICDNLGRTVFMEKGKFIQEYQTNIGHLPAGMYLVFLKSKEKIWAKKCVLNK